MRAGEVGALALRLVSAALGRCGGASNRSNDTMAEKPEYQWLKARILTAAGVVTGTHEPSVQWRGGAGFSPTAREPRLWVGGHRMGEASQRTVRMVPEADPDRPAVESGKPLQQKSPHDPCHHKSTPELSL